MSKKIAKKQLKAVAKNGNSAAKKQGQVIRIVQLKGGALVRVTKAGVITDARLSERHKITKPFKTWTEIAADTWAGATKQFRNGGGKKVALKSA